MAAGYATMGYDTSRNLLMFKHHDGQSVRTSNFRTDDEIKNLVPLTEATDTGASLVSNASERRLVRLSAGDNITIGKKSGLVSSRDHWMQIQTQHSRSMVGKRSQQTSFTMLRECIRVHSTAPTNLDGLSDAATNATSVAVGQGSSTGVNSVALGVNAQTTVTTASVSVGFAANKQGTGVD